MDVMDLVQYVVDEALIIVPVLWVIGAFLKQTPFFANWAIVWVLLFVGIVLTMALLGTSVVSFIQGILVTGVAVMGHQLLKQTLEGLNGDDKRTPK
jgi:hypothetical protein